ncbi:MAG: HAD hydrolase family protein [Chloroflexi bacterium]|nr:HAD hydrolase family protein [Chloroflexota bacterium]
MVLAAGSRLEKLGDRFRYSDVIGVVHPSFRDGFLAVASVVGFAVLITRAYRAVYGRSEEDISGSLSELVREATSFSSLAEIRSAADGVIAGRQYVSVLYSSELAAAAVDVESRFVEAALGGVHIADLRNFGHGRHFWMARKAAETGVVALISEEQKQLGDRTVSLLPDEVAVLRIGFRGAKDVQGVAGLVAGLYLAASAAGFAGVDPGRPGVPKFGRSLYHLKAYAGRTSQGVLNRSAALSRKGARPEDGWWIEKYENALERVNTSRYEALVLDYDGTLCDSREREEPWGADMAGELKRLVDEGAVLGLATGRGPSAGIELRAALPTELHSRVLVGYYNGAVIRFLTEAEDPLVDAGDGESSLLSSLLRDPMLNGSVRSNAVQISTGVRQGVRVEDGAEEVRLILRQNGVDAEVVTSAHSVDVCLGGQSKEDLLAVMRSTFGLTNGPILRVGDRGRRPGNDWKLLDDPHGLSVDQVSGDPVHCWSLTPAGTKGTQAAVHYLKCLHWTGGEGRLRLSRSSRP